MSAIKKDAPRERFKHGWQMKRVYVESPSLFIGPLPGRKSIAIYTVEGSVLDVHGYFRSREDAERVYDLLEEMISGKLRDRSSGNGG